MTRPGRLCAVASCWNLVPCPIHARPSSSAAQGYGAAHRAWRLEVLARDPICRICNEAPATIADHVVSFNAGGARFDLENGQGLCETCHNRKTATRDGGFGRPRQH